MDKFKNSNFSASRRLTEALAYTASEYHEIGQVFDAHTKNDMEPVLENLYSYKGTVQNVPDIIQVHKVLNRGPYILKWKSF